MRGSFFARGCAAAGVLLGLLALGGRGAQAEPAYALGLYGPQDVKRGPDEPFPYVNPAAPKGGRLVMAAFTQVFTKLNPYSLKGIPAPLLDLVFETPAVSSAADDEPFTVYGHLVESFDLAPDHLSLVCKLRPEARFSDGVPVTADDFVFSFNLMQDPEFNPMYRQYFADIRALVKVDEHTVRYEFARVNQELPLIAGQMPVLPKHVYGAPGKQFGKDFDEIAVGSGPYVVESFDFGRGITVRRNPEWWGRNLPRSRGLYNFDTITAKVYQDSIAMNEALKGGEFDVRMVNISKDWATDFRGPFVQKNYLVRQEIPHNRPVSMQGYVFNLRKPLFQSQKLRYALAMVFDFQWSNANLFFNQYQRTRCFFENSPDLTSVAAPSGALLEALTDLRNRHGKDAVPKPALDLPLQAPGEGTDPQAAMQAAEGLLDSIGWRRGPDGVRVKDGKRLEFELLIDEATWERVSEPYQRRLARLGAVMNIRLVQPPEYEKRERAFEYDMVVSVYGQSRSPGNEQLDAYGSKAADIPGSRNLMGLKNPAVDEILEKLVQARSRRDLAFQCQALDHVLMGSTLVVPHWYLNRDRVLFWNKFGRPQRHCSQGLFEGVVRDTWWADPDKEKRLKAAMAAGEPLPAEPGAAPAATP